MDEYSYSCKAIILIDNQKVKCNVLLTLKDIQLTGNFSNGKAHISKFENFRNLSTSIGDEKIGFFTKRYVEIKYNNKSLRRLYFKHKDDAQNFCDAIKSKQAVILKENEENRIAEEQRKNKLYDDAKKLESKSNISDLEQAISKFNTIIEWKDSKKHICICKSKIVSIKKRARRK